MFLRRPTSHKPHRRSGMLAPILALVLLVVLGLIALVLDRLWLDMASAEAQGVAEAAALAAGQELASDDTLRAVDPGPEERIRLAKLAAENVAAMNRVAGRAFTLNADDGEVIFGANLVAEDTGETRFVESLYNAQSVRVLAQRTRAKRNPVALFFGGLTRVPAGDVAAMAEATLDNHVVGFQNVGEARIPALPLAILAHAPAGSRIENWRDRIERRQGTDNYRYDPATRTVVFGRDGIPEIVLSCPTNGSKPAESNMRLFCMHQQHEPNLFEDQIRLGWSPQHLAHRDGRILLTRGPEVFMASRTVLPGCLTALKEIVGECRAVMLFREERSTDNENWGRIQSGGFVAGRVMAVIDPAGQDPQIIFQPGVLASRSVMVMSDLDSPELTTTAGDAASALQPAVNYVVPANKYLYQLKLTQ